jgi:hypothetical protein
LIDRGPAVGGRHIEQRAGRSGRQTARLLITSLGTSQCPLSATPSAWQCRSYAPSIAVPTRATSSSLRAFARVPVRATVRVFARGETARFPGTKTTAGEPLSAAPRHANARRRPDVMLVPQRHKHLFISRKVRSTERAPGLCIGSCQARFVMNS